MGKVKEVVIKDFNESPRIANLEYWDRISQFTAWSEVKRIKEVTYTSNINLFEQFCKINNSLRYCNGAFYKFQDYELHKLYMEWLDSDDYTSRAMDLYYGKGIVD